VKSVTTTGLVLCTTLLSTTGLAATSSTASGTVPGAQKYEQGPPGSITDTRVHTRDSDLSVLLWLPWYYGFGIGGQVRFEIPILPDGFIPAINDEFALEPSFGIDYYNYGGFANSIGTLNFAPALYGIWRFHFSEEFSAYGGLGLGVNIGTYSGDYGGLYNPIYFYWDLVAGLNYMFTKGMAFRAELGSQGLKAGLSFYF